MEPQSKILKCTKIVNACNTKEPIILHKLGYNCLNDFQKEILEESLNKIHNEKLNCLGLAFPIGSGKTIISMVLSLRLIEEELSTENRILAVCSKTLIENWKEEINKFFGDKLKYEIVLPNADLSKLKFKEDTKLVLTTIDIMAKCYKENLINKEFITANFVLHHAHLGAYINYYNEPVVPYLNHLHGSGLFYSISWKCIIIDEAQTYTNILTHRCQSLGALSANYRLLLSGTLFDEPKAERILGYHILLNAPNKPRNLPDTKILIKSTQFKGLNELIVYRKTNLAFIPPKVNNKIVTHKLSLEEEKIYCMMRIVLIAIKNKAKEAKLLGNRIEQKLFNSYKLVMIMYLRQSLICSLLPITSIIIEASGAKNRSALSTIILNELNVLGLTYYLNDTKSVTTTRFSAVLSTLSSFNEKCILFSCFASCLDILEFLLQNLNKPIFRMTAKMTCSQRGNLIKDFSATINGVLLMTYELGATGLNLQFATTVFLMDYWWNASKAQQAIGRIFRYGQIADQINIVFFSANTAIENIIFEKQNAKLQILEELKIGKQITAIPSIKINEIIKMIELEHNQNLLQKIHQF